MQRYCFLIGLKSETLAEYVRVHAQVWPDVLAQISRSNIKNYSIFLREPENLLVGYYEYHGVDHEADMALMAADPVTQKWWDLCMPMQSPMSTRKDGEWWAPTRMVFQLEGQLER